jgi:molecular chaperone DnaK
MQSDAEAHAEEDKKKMELIEVKNTADVMIHTAEKSLKDAGDKVSEELKKEINDAIAEVKKSRDGTDIDMIKKSSEMLSDKMMKIGEAMKTANDNAAKDASQNDSGTQSDTHTDQGETKQ